MAASSLSNRSCFSGISSSSMIVPSPLPRATSPLSSTSADGSWPDNFRVWENGGGLVHVEAVVDSSAVIEPSAVVHAEARIDAKTRIGSGSVVGPYVKIGAETTVWYNVSLTNCTIGDRCVFHNGVQIGQDGFGFFVDESGSMVKKPQTLGVQIGSDVEMGANTCVDRGSWRDTQIGDYVKIDNLVQIGHNVVIGRCCIICGQTGIGGSSTLGDYVVLAGQVGVADHVTIADKVRVAAKSGVASDIKEPGDYAGFPTVKASEWRRLVVMERRMMKGTAPAADRSAPSSNPMVKKA
ncbi:unnamed protein product [Closterium sp. NIES-64]|nr:unnamed protein product [Closterium sp. NIES-64]